MSGIISVALKLFVPYLAIYSLVLAWMLGWMKAKWSHHFIFTFICFVAVTMKVVEFGCTFPVVWVSASGIHGSIKEFADIDECQVDAFNSFFLYVVITFSFIFLSVVHSFYASEASDKTTRPRTIVRADLAPGTSIPEDFSSSFGPNADDFDFGFYEQPRQFA